MLLGQAQVLHRRAGGEAYVHFLNTDRRLDEWVPESQLRVAESHEVTEPIEVRGKKRKRMSSRHLGSPSVSQNGAHARGVSQDGPGRSAHSASSDGFVSEEDSDTGEHLRLTAKRNFDRVNFGHWQIKTWRVAFVYVYPRYRSFLSTGTFRLIPCQNLSRRRVL